MVQMVTSTSSDEAWNMCLAKIENDLNTSANKTTGRSAFELLFGYIARFKDGQIRELTVDNETYTDPKCLQAEAVHHMIKERQKYKEQYDKHRYKGDILLMKRAIIPTGESTKLQRKCRWPLDHNTSIARRYL